jgi:YD repeat-containing protein
VLNDALEVTAILGAGADNRYQYDGLGRLRSINDPQSVPKGTFGYDATGNRTAATWLGTTSSLTYPSTSHRLSAFAGESRTYDAIGNPLTLGARQLRYDDRAKLAQVTLPGGEVWQYGYTGQGLRVTKRKADDASSLHHFVYDESAQLIGEYDHAGAPLREVIWLGNLSIGVIDASAATPVLHYIESDHLGTYSTPTFRALSFAYP